MPCLSLALDGKEILFHRFSYSKQISKRQSHSFSYLISIDECMQTLKANNSLLFVSITLTYKSMEDDLGTWNLAAWKTSHLGFCFDIHTLYRRETNNTQNISQELD